jgi:hypothetical protein
MSDLRFVSPEELEQELERRRLMVEDPTPIDEPPEPPPTIPPVQQPQPQELGTMGFNINIPRIKTTKKQRLPQNPTPKMPNYNIDVVRVILSQIWANTILSFVITALLGVILMMVAIETLLYQAFGIFGYLFVLSIFWIFTNKNLSPKTI